MAIQEKVGGGSGAAGGASGSNLVEMTWIRSLGSWAAWDLH